METACFQYCKNLIFTLYIYIICGPGNSVGIATDYGLDDSGSNPRGIPVGRRFSAHPDRPWGLPSLLYNEYRVFLGGKVRPGRDADHSLPSSVAFIEE